MTSPLHPYNTIERARRWYHDNAGIEGEGATGRRHLGWVLEVLYEMKSRLKELEKQSEYKLSIREPPPMDLQTLLATVDEFQLAARAALDPSDED